MPVTSKDQTKIEPETKGQASSAGEGRNTNSEKSRLHALIDKSLPSGGFARNVLALMSGSVLGQVIMAAAAPVLTRLYTPEEFGTLALYVSIVTVGAVVLSWRYEMAIVLPEDDRDAANLFILSLAVAVGMTILSGILIVLFRSSIVGILGNADIGPWLWIMPLSLLALGLYQVFNSWFTRKRLFKGIAISKIGQSSAAVSVQIGTGLSSMGTVGLIAGQVAGAVMATAILARRIIKDDLKYILKSLNKRRMLDAAARYKKYPIYSTWPAFVNTLSLSLPVIFMTRYLDAKFVGQYALSMRVLLIPLFLIGASIGKVYFQKLAQEKNESGNISPLVESTFRKLIMISIPGALLLMVFSPFLFGLIFGENWRMAGEFTRILAPAMAIRFVASPLSTAFGVSNRQEVAARWQVSQLICTVSFLFAGLQFDNPIAIIYALTINDMLLYVIFMVLIFRISGAKFRRAMKLSRS